jgi:Glycosyltransferase family 87
MASERLRTNLWFAYLCVLICWSVQAYALIGEWLHEGTLFAHTENGRPYISDFVNVYGMAYLANRSLHEHVDFYDPNVQAETAKLFTAPVVAEIPFTFQYPPWFFPLLMPLSQVSITSAFLIWDFLGVLFIAWAVCLLAFSFHKSSFARVFVMVAVFASYPTWLCLRLGQTAWINFAALTAFWWLIGQSRSFLAGLAASVFIMKFQYLPLPFLVGLMRGRLKFILGFALVSALLFALTVVTVGWSNIACYPQVILGIGVGKNVSGVSPELMQNLRGALVLITNEDNQLVHVIAFGFLAIVSLAAVIFRDSKKTNQIDSNFKIKASICSLLLLIASPHTHIQDYLVATIPALWLWQATSWQSAPLLRRAILAFPLISWIFYFLRPIFMLVRIQPFFVWALLVIFLAVKELQRPPNTSASDAEGTA